jgi:CheY-like chemotaxis protein
MAKLLFVEDNSDIRRLLAKRLARRGYEVVEAVNGEEGVRLAESESPDLILMDMAMPVMDGIQASCEIRKRPELAGVPIIALTAFSDEGKREAAAKAGCSDYITKPIQFDGLLTKIQTWLEGKSE